MNFTIRNPSPALQFRSNPQRRASTRRIIVHHYHHETATPQDVHRWHLNNGWIGIGYHFMVDMDGTIWRGRGELTVGAHAGGHNNDSIGIACQGRYDDNTRNMPDAQFNAMVWLIQHLRGTHGNLTLQRHRDVGSTACPGRHFPWTELQGLRFREQASTPNAPTPEVGHRVRITTQNLPLNVRAGAGTNHAVIGSVARLSEHTVVELRNGWYRLQQLFGGRQGWISRDFTQRVTVTTNSFRVRITTRVLPLNVRSGAGTGYTVLATVPRNSEQTIVETRSGWGRLQNTFNGRQGWVSLEHTTRI